MATFALLRFRFYPFLLMKTLPVHIASSLKVMCPCKYSSSAGGMPNSREISCDHSSKYNSATARFNTNRLLTYFSLSLYVPCPFKTWAIMAFHSFLSFVLLSSSCSFIPPLCPSGTRSAIHMLKLVKYFILGLPLLFFPSMRPVSVKFSTLSFLVTCPKNSN